MRVSNELKIGLRVFGFAKIAAQVMRDQQEYADDVETIAGAARSVAMKIAANRKNEATIAEGLSSLRLTKGL